MAPHTESECAADLALVRAALAREERAIQELGDRLKCVPRILAAQNARYGRPLNEHDLADLAQDAAVVILRKLREYEGRAPVEGWIYQMCRLEFMNSMRRKRKAPKQLAEIEVAAGDTTNGANTEALADRDHLAIALERVGGVEAEAVALKHYEGLTFEEMAQRLDIPASTLKTRYYKGMSRLEAILTTLRQGREQ